MPTDSQNILAQTLILGGTIVPLGGDTESVDIQLGDRNRTRRSASGRTIAQRIRTPDDQLVVNFYPFDPGHKVLRGLIAAKEAAVKLSPATSLGLGPGGFTDGASGERYAWSDSILTSPAGGQGGEDTNTRSWTFTLVDVEVVLL